MNPLSIGLCAKCEFVKIIENDRGSQFIFCQKSQLDASFSKYPRLPVLQCKGFVEKAIDSDDNNS